MRSLKSLGSNYYERLDCLPSTHYQFYNNHIHVDDGVYIEIGKWHMYDKVTKEHNLLPYMKLEVNLNKHHDKAVMDKIRDFIADETAEGDLRRYDFAVDIPAKMENVKIFKSRKEKGLYKGTVYRGQRNKHGYTKIYDKQVEQGLSDPLTRVEYTFATDKQRTYEDIYVFTAVKNEQNIDDLDVRPSVKSFVKMVNILNMLGYETEEYMDSLNYRTRLKVEPYVTGCYSKVDYDEQLLDQLLGDVKHFLLIDESRQSCRITTDDDGFVKMEGDFDFFNL
jgi:hypothetical protein